MKLILASKSPRRIQILKDHGFKFEIIPADIDEENYTHLEPEEMVKTLSILKAQKIAKNYKDAIILGSDTTISLNGENIGKPTSIKNAKEILSKLSDKTHLVITGFTIIDTKNNKTNTFTEISKVTFKKINQKEIDDYVSIKNILDLAGGYAIQEEGGNFVRSYEGDYLNIVGLPSIAINKLSSFGVK
jgi:septum formation protein